MEHPELDDRKAAILRAVVEEYVETAQPVGSQTIARASRLGVSSATVRNEMTVLERDGYLVRERSGRRNTYTVTSGRPLRHPAERNSSVDDLLAVFE